MNSFQGSGNLFGVSGNSFGVVQTHFREVFGGSGDSFGVEWELIWGERELI